MATTLSQSYQTVRVPTREVTQIETAQSNPMQEAIEKQSPLPQQDLIDPMNPVLNAGLQGFIADFSLIQQWNRYPVRYQVQEVVSAYESAKAKR